MTYYTPNIKDLHIGYECDVYNQSTSKLVKRIGWNSVKIGMHQENGKTIGFTQCPRMIKNETLRTPFLIKQQIITEGWEDHSCERATFFLIKGDYFLTLKEGHLSIVHTRFLDYSRTGNYNGSVYEGNCPSINEFRKIVELLNI